MAKTISGILEEDARLIVFDEVVGVVEHNELTSSGTYEISGLSDNKKTIITRSTEGESHGYGDVEGAAPLYPLEVTNCSQHSASFTDESYHKATTYCDGTTLPGNTSSFVHVTGVDNTDSTNYVGSTGANLMSVDNFDKSGVTILEFDWYPPLNTAWNTSGVEVNAQHYIVLVDSSTWSIDAGRYLYGHVRGASLRVSFNSRLDRIYTYAIDGGSINTGYVTETTTENTWIPVKIKFDWVNGLLDVWANNNLAIDGRSFTTSIGSEFKLGFHWHTYTKTGYHAYRNIKLYYE